MTQIESEKIKPKDSTLLPLRKEILGIRPYPFGLTFTPRCDYMSKVLSV